MVDFSECVGCKTGVFPEKTDEIGIVGKVQLSGYVGYGQVEINQ